MVRKLVYFLSFALTIGLAANAFGDGEFYGWTGVGLDGMWNNPDNWSMFAVPPHMSGNVGLTDQTNGSLITIPAGFVADATFGVGFGTIFGPEFGMDLDIYGGLNYDWSMATFANNPLSPTVVNMFDGSFLGYINDRPEDVAIGNVWWDHTGPYVTMNMYGSAASYTNWFWFGGHLNMYGGTLDVLTGVAMTGNNDALTLMDIYEGKMILPDAFTATVQDWISRGILKAYGHTPGTEGYDIVIDTQSMSGRTIITATPEPCTLALLCLGGLALIRRKRS
jgi:hypothetical protein